MELRHDNKTIQDNQIQYANNALDSLNKVCSQVNNDCNKCILNDDWDGCPIDFLTSKLEKVSKENK